MQFVRRLFIFMNHRDLWEVFGPISVRVVETEKDLEWVMYEIDRSLARGRFSGVIPICTLVEEYAKRVDFEGPGENGNDWVFENAWAPTITREQAFEQAKKLITVDSITYDYEKE